MADTEWTWYNPTTWGAGDEFVQQTPEQAAAAQAETERLRNTQLNAGTTYEKNALTAAEDAKLGRWYGADERDFMYGRTPGGADAAVNLAQQTGAGAQAYGLGISDAAWQTAGQYGNRQAMQGDWQQQNAALAGADSYGNQLAGLESQQGPSAAQAQLQQGTNQAVASQIAMARSGRGFGGGAASAGLAQSNLAGIQASNANNSAMLRAQEDAAWRQRQAANFGAAAGIQQGNAAQFGQQQGMDLNAYYQNQGQNDAGALGFAGLGTQAGLQGYGVNLQGQGLGAQVRGMELDSGIKREDTQLRQWAAENNLNLGNKAAEDQKEAGYFSAAASGAAALMSDIRAKENIIRTDAPATDFARGVSDMNFKPVDVGALDAVAAAPGYGYQYIDPSERGAEAGPQYGPMAQDLASTPAGATAVDKGKDGKLQIDPARLTTLNTSAISAQQRELDEVKRQLALFSAQPAAPRVIGAPSQGSF